jgi:DNA-binding YbaB/EbfC family protein
MDLSNLFGKIGEVQAQMQQLRAQLDNMTAEGEAGGGMVRATVTAGRRVVKIQIDPSILSDGEMVEDLTAAAVNKALERAEDVARDEMSKITGNIIPGMGGLDLKQFGL